MILNPTPQFPHALSDLVPLTSPPPHKRPLYWTIPLPPDDDLFAAKVSSEYDTLRASMTTRSAPSRPSLVHPRRIPSAHPPITVGGIASLVPHPILDQTYFLERFETLETQSLLLEDRARYRSVPATNPPMRKLTIVVLPAGQLINVSATATSNPDAVTVGDVIDALESICVSLMNPEEGRRREFEEGRMRRGRECERIAVISNYLQLRWATAAEMGLQPWHVVICRR